MNRNLEKIKEELLAILPPTIFFFVALHIVALIRVLMLKGTGIDPSTTVTVAIAALILGKSVLLADMLPIINRFPEKPLIYDIAWKTIIYLLIAAIMHYLERLVDFWRAAGSFVAGNEKGQLIFIVAVLAVAAIATRLLRTHAVPRWTAVMPAYLIGGVASYWVFERIAAFWS